MLPYNTKIHPETHYRCYFASIQSC